jgi:hypothetical protein
MCNSFVRLSLLFGYCALLEACVHSNDIGNFKVSDTSMPNAKMKTVAVVISEPEVKDTYNNGRLFIWTGVNVRLKSAFKKKLKPNFAKVIFVKKKIDGKKSDLILTVEFEIKDVSADVKNKCAIDFRVDAFADGGQKKIATKEDSGFNDIWFSSGSSDCREVMDELFDSVVNEVLEAVEGHFK